ncbi:extracellular calcium-sensing receptor-like [Glandiceps talaboti]
MVRLDDDLASGPITEKCENFNLEVFQWAESMVYAVNEINSRTDILENVTIGYDIRDTCDSVSKAMDNAVDFIQMTMSEDVKAVKAVIGAGMSSVTMAVASTLGVLNIPLIGYVSTSPLLSNKLRYKSFFRTIPSDELQVKAMIEIVERYGWNAVGTLATDDDYGRFAIEELEKGLEERNICVAFRELVPNQSTVRQVHEVVKRIKQKSEIKVILTFIHEADMKTVVRALSAHNVTDRLWIACESWGENKEVAAEGLKVLDGTIGVLLMEGIIPGFNEYLSKMNSKHLYATDSPFLVELLESMLGCRFNDDTDWKYNSSYAVDEQTKVDKLKTRSSKSTCPTNLSLTSIPIYTDTKFRVSYNVYLAVLSVSTALDNILKCKNGSGFLADGMCPDIQSLQPWQLLRYMNNVTFLGTQNDTFSFGRNGDGLGVYHLVNWQINKDGDDIEVVPIGYYDNRILEGDKLQIDDTKIVWSNHSQEVPVSECAIPCVPGTRKAVLEGQPKCCHQCVACAEGEITNETDLAVCITCPNGYWSNHNNTLCVLKTQDYLSWAETSGIVAWSSAAVATVLTGATLLIFILNRNTPVVKAANKELCLVMLVFLFICFVCCLSFIGHPNTLQCQMQIIQGIFHTACVSIILVKTHRILTIFRSKLPSALQERRFARLQLQLFLLGVLVAIHIGLVAALLVLAPPVVVYNNELSKTVTYIHCTSSNVVFTLSTSMYTWLVSGICLILAFKSRKLPDNFNEAKFITFAMVLYFIVWSFYYPSSILTYGKLRALFRCLVNIISGSALLVSIFIPKCYIILCKRELNTKAAIQRGTRQHSMKVTSRALELTPTKRSISFGSECNHLNAKERQPLSSAEILV